MSLEEETHESLKCSPAVMKKVKVNEEANEKDLYIKSEGVLGTLVSINKQSKKVHICLQ